MKTIFALNLLINTYASKQFRQSLPVKERKLQATVAENGICTTMIPPSPLPPDDSTCWQWWTPPSDGIITPDMATPPKGCDYTPCEAAVCACDDYCCSTAWDLSCRGYFMSTGDDTENNFFVPGCSAKLLCCEPESAFPDPPIGGAMSATSTTFNNAVSVSVPISEISDQCEPGTPLCCETMIPPSYFPPRDSSCWDYFVPPADGVMTGNMPEPPKGCDYVPCENAVCACDSYCCDVAWDESCRGYELEPGTDVDNNYFVDGCSARILCCEYELEGGLVTGGAVDITDINVLATENTDMNVIGDAPVALPMTEMNVVVPEVVQVVIPQPLPVPVSVPGPVIEVSIPEPVPVANPVEVTEIVQVNVPQPLPVGVPIAVPVAVNVDVPVSVPIPVAVPVKLPVPNAVPIPFSAGATAQNVNEVDISITTKKEITKEKFVSGPTVEVTCICPPPAATTTYTTATKGVVYSTSGKGKAGGKRSRKLPEGTNVIYALDTSSSSKKGSYVVASNTQYSGTEKVTTVASVTNTGEACVCPVTTTYSNVYSHSGKGGKRARR